jgi:hypothetical protein
MSGTGWFETWRQRLIRPRVLVSVVLALTGLALLGNMVGLFTALNERGRANIDSVREDTVWATYQLEREANRLYDVLRDPPWEQTDWADQVGQRYDILYSRTSLLSQGQIAERFGDGFTWNLTGSMGRYYDRKRRGSPGAPAIPSAPANPGAPAIPSAPPIPGAPSGPSTPTPSRTPTTAPIPSVPSDSSEPPARQDANRAALSFGSLANPAHSEDHS